MLNYNFNIDNNTPNKSVLVIDSGNGGKWTLKYLQKKLPNENFIFFEDDFNAPYGKKSKLKLKKITKKNIDFLLKNYQIKAIVLACNTLSATVNNFIKNSYENLPLICIKPCIKNFKKNTLILCTKTTKKYSNEVKKIKSNKNVFILHFKDLARKIDKNIENLSIFQHFFDKKLKKYANMGISNVVLGCTHYNFIKPQITNALLKNPFVKYEKKYKILSTKKVLKQHRFLNLNFSKNIESNIKIFAIKKPCIKFYESSKDVAENLANVLRVTSIQNKNKYKGEVIFLKSSQLQI